MQQNTRLPDRENPVIQMIRPRVPVRNRDTNHSSKREREGVHHATKDPASDLQTPNTLSDANLPIFTGIYPQTCIRHSITPPQQALRRGIGLRRRYEEVGTAGFEPATSAPPERCATELRHVPNKHESIMEESKTGSVGAAPATSGGCEFSTNPAP